MLRVLLAEIVLLFWSLPECFGITKWQGRRIDALADTSGAWVRTGRVNAWKVDGNTPKASKGYRLNPTAGHAGIARSPETRMAEDRLH